jgi:NADPH:quinone reductase-like Zn-dependent oxidoreductase
MMVRFIERPSDTHRRYITQILTGVAKILDRTEEGCPVKCLLINGSEDDLRLSVADTPKPSLGPGQVLIEVWAAGVITTEIYWQPTWHTATGDKRVDTVPGHEFSGVVAAVGEDVQHFETGDQIFGMNDWYSNGAMAEYCLANPADLSTKPPYLTHVQAASVPISALTAWQGLFEHARLQPGETVLVHGAAGSVGAFAVELARVGGARVIGTASARDGEFVLGLGADRVIDYRSMRFEEHVKDVDVVFDTVGGETLERSWAVLRPGGRLVTIAYTAADGSGDKRARDAAFIVKPSGTQLAEISKLAEHGSVHAFVDRVVPLRQSPEIYSGRLPRERPGKVVVAIRS